MQIEVVYAEAQLQRIAAIDVSEGATIADALAAASATAGFADINIAGLKTGIYGKLAGPDTVLQEGDRVEIYRPLQADPKVTRRRRAAKDAKKY
jgi:putative ubiquitin-RnfH superfamily antitoxin RatB of RatAB toxin-antitoxin module